jgi:hypothetical protein
MAATLTFPPGKLCGIRKVLLGELYMVEITKTEAGPVDVVAIQDDTKEALPTLATDEAAFLALLTPEQMGRVGLEDILQTFVKSLCVTDPATMALGVVMIDKEAEAREMAKWKQEALKVQQKKEEAEDRIRQERARKRARRERDRLENQALAREHLRQRVQYARKIMQIEVERMKKLKEARAKAQKEIEMTKPELVLPVGLLLKVRRVINGEMATLEITKVDAGDKKVEEGKGGKGGKGAVEFKTTGDSGDVHTLLTSEKELVDLLDEKHIREQSTTSDLLRVFSKMIVFEQTEKIATGGQASTPFGLRLHAVDEAAEAERIRQWRDKASRIENSTKSPAPSEVSRPSTAMSVQEPADVPKITHAAAAGHNNGKSILLVESLIAGERLPNGMEVEMSFGEGSRRKAYTVTLKLSGHKLSFTACLKNSSGANPLLYSCSLDHALMLLPTEKQLWDTERGLFNSLRRCIQIINGGRSLVLRRNARGSLARDRGYSIAQKIAEEAGLPSPDDDDRRKTRRGGNGQRGVGISSGAWGDFGSRRQAHAEENQELMKLIEEQYLHASFDADDEVFGLDWIEREQKHGRRRKRGRRGKSVKTINGSTPEDIARRLAAIEGTHRELLPASRGPSRGASRGGPGAGRLDSAIVRDISERTQMDKLKIFGGFGKCSSRAVLRKKFPSLDDVQSSILSEQGSVAARERLHMRLQPNYLGPGVDPLIPLEARPKGSLFVKKILRDLLNGDTQTVSGIVPADLPAGMSSWRRTVLVGGGSTAFQMVAQRNSWGSPERRRGPGYRTLACKWERKKKAERAKTTATRRAEQRLQHKLQHDRGLD